MRSRSMTFALGGVALFALVFAVACGGGYSSPTVATPPPSGGGGGNGNIVTIAGFAFSSITVKVGDAISWKNNDSTAHTATADNGSFDTGVIAPGATSSAITMSTAGTFTYHCQIHPFMVGTVNVTQ